jgi:hypothetical protein
MTTLKSLITFFHKNTLVKAGDALTDKLVNDLKLVGGEHFIKLDSPLIGVANTNKAIEQLQAKAKV